MASGLPTAGQSGILGLLNSLWTGNTSFNPNSPFSSLSNFLGGLTGSSNPLYDIMAILSFINEGQVTQDQLNFMQNVMSKQTGSLNTASSPNELSAWRTALTPQSEEHTS